jgi:hypothetical protein
MARATHPDREANMSRPRTTILVLAVALAGIATATAYAATAALFPRVPVSCHQVKNTRTPGYSVGCVKLNRSGYATYINARSVAVVDTRTGRVVFQRNH